MFRGNWKEALVKLEAVVVDKVEYESQDGAHLHRTAIGSTGHSLIDSPMGELIDVDCPGGQVELTASA